MQDELPESWRNALARQSDGSPPLAGSPAPVQRPPIQPQYKIWPWGLLSVAVPVLAGALALVLTLAVEAASAARTGGVSTAFSLPVLLAVRPTFPAAFGVLAVILFANGWACARALDPELSAFSFARGGAIGALFCGMLFLIPNATGVYIALLAVYVGLRVLNRMGALSFLMFGAAGTAFTLVAVTLNTVFSGAMKALLNSSDVAAALLFFSAYTLSHALLTSRAPVESGFFARIDAAFSGVSSALLGLLAGTAFYRVAVQVAPLIDSRLAAPFSEWIAVGCGLAGGNAVCVWTLFRNAYSARPERPPGLPRNKANSTAQGEHMRTESDQPAASYKRRYAKQAPKSARVSVDDEASVDDAT